MLESPAVTTDARSDEESTSYGSIFAELRENVRAYVRGLFRLPAQELRELLAANLDAAKWIAIGAVLVLLALVALVVVLIALLALVLPLWAAALLVFVALLLLGGVIAYFLGVKRLVLRGPERTIRSVKETIAWVKATLLGRSAS